MDAKVFLGSFFERIRYARTIVVALLALLPLLSAAVARTLKMKISGAIYSDEIAIRFMPEATCGFDGCCDAWKLFVGNTAVPQLFTKTNAGDELAINSMPLSNGNDNMDVFVRTGIAATYSFSITQMDSFPASTTLSLIDNVTGNTYDLRSPGPHAIALPVIPVNSAPRFTVKISPLTLLPVELVLFTARTEKSAIKLYWKTASEVNNKSFTVERAAGTSSGNAGLMEWKETGEVPGFGNSSLPQNYEFTDAHLPSPQGEGLGLPAGQAGVRYYYRLIQEDYNGDQHIYGPITVTRATSEEVIIYPAISNGFVYISGKLENAGIIITAPSGKQVFESRPGDKSPVEPMGIELPFLSNGIYFLTVITGSDRITQKIIINH